jgi:hypothetical protein
MALGNSIQGASRGQIAQCIEQRAKGLATFATFHCDTTAGNCVLENSVMTPLSLDGLAHLGHRISFFVARL